jgi:hypothetical protein
MRKQILDEVRFMQKIAGILKEDDDFDLSDNPLRVYSQVDREFLNFVFEILNDEMRSGTISEEDFDNIVDYIENNKREIVDFNDGDDSGYEAAIQYLMSKF